jgi:hypothetical protein
MRRGLVLANDALAFFLELLALAALAYLGWTLGSWPAAIALPLIAIVLWWLFAAPRARITVPLAVKLAVKTLVFGGAAVGLFATGHVVLATVFAVIAAVNTAIGVRYSQAIPSPSRSKS